MVVLGTTGEYPSFSVAERKKVAETALKHRSGLAIIVQVGTTNFPETIDLLAHAAANGADGVLCIPPFYYKKPALEGLAKYYSLILEASKIPVHLYHIPGTSAVPITNELLHAWNIIPTWPASRIPPAMPRNTQSYVKEFPKLNMMTGTGNNLKAALQAGMGAILADANLFPKQAADVFAAHRAGKDMDEPYNKLRELNTALRPMGVNSYGPMKYALSLMMGTRQTYQRPPHLDVTEEQKTQIKSKLRRTGVTGLMRRSRLRSSGGADAGGRGPRRARCMSRTPSGPPMPPTWQARATAPLDQINASNFSKLEVAWRFKTDSLGNRPEYKLEGTPLMVNGVVYATAGSRRAAIALDAATGELLWVHGEHEGARGAAAPRQLSGRGLAYWTDGKEERILYVTPGYRLIALDAKTGALVPSSAKRRRVDLKLDDDQTILPDLTTGEIGLQSAPVVAKDTIIIGAAFREGMTPKSMRNNKGYVRGFDVRTGKRLWIFHTIPDEGRARLRHLGERSAEYTGNTGVWTQITVDEQLGLVYLPVESPTGDYYGGHRPGNNLYGESLVCVDLKTGAAQVALPVGAPSAVGHGHLLGAAAGRHQRGRHARSKRSRSPPSRASCMCSIA